MEVAPGQERGNCGVHELRRDAFRGGMEQRYGYRRVGTRGGLIRQTADAKCSRTRVSSPGHGMQELEGHSACFGDFALSRCIISLRIEREGSCEQ